MTDLTGLKFVLFIFDFGGGGNTGRPRKKCVPQNKTLFDKLSKFCSNNLEMGTGILRMFVGFFKDAL